MSNIRALVVGALCSFVILLVACAGPDDFSAHSDELTNARPLGDDEFTATVVWTTDDFVSGRTGVLCTGAVVGRREILTGAHCVAHSERRRYVDRLIPALRGNPLIRVTNVRAVDTSRRSDFELVRVRDVIVAPTWRDGARRGFTYDDMLSQSRVDLAIIRVAQDLTAVLGTQPASLGLDTVTDGTNVTLTGYGCETSYWDVASERWVHNWGNIATGERGLGAVRTPEFAANLSRRVDGGQGLPLEWWQRNGRNFMYTHGPRRRNPSNSRAGLCAGDSGGPVYLRRNPQRIVGVISGGHVAWNDPTTTLSFLVRFDREAAEFLRRELPHAIR